MCCFSCTPIDTEELSLDLIYRLINESASIDQIKSIAITGGEPFVDYTKIVSIFNKIHDAKKKASIITNAFWASSVDVAANRLQELRDLGLTRLNISYDIFHKIFVKTQNVKNLLEASIVCKIPTTLNMVISSKQDYSSIFYDLGESLIGCDVRISPCLPVGRAQRFLVDDDYIKKFSIVDDFRCNFGRIFVVHYDGKVYPCCSQFIEEESLCLGKASELTLKEIVYKLEHSRLLHAIRNMNLKKFYECLPERERNKFPDRYVHDCEFCSYIFKEENFRYFNDCVKSAFLEK